MIELGQNVKDSVTGFTGIATGKSEYLGGYVSVCIAPSVGNDGKKPDAEWFDASRVEAVS